MANDQRRPAGRRVGEVARAAGLTVRTLRHYEQIGLLVPSARTDAGHRLYGEADMARLYRICLLRQLGLPLAEIARALDDDTWSMPVAIARQLRELDRRQEAVGRLRSRLAGLLTAADAGDAGLTAELLATVEGYGDPDRTDSRTRNTVTPAGPQAAGGMLWLSRNRLVGS